MAIATLQNAIKQVQKAMENKILRDLSSMVNKARKLKKMRLPHSYAHKIVAETQDVPPGINYNKVVNYNCAQAKRDMAKALETQKKDNYIYNRPTIDPYKIIRIVNTAWPKLFARIEYNKKAIAERGWLPYNRALMLHPTICASISNQEEELELGDSTKIIIPQQASHKIIDLTKDAPSFNPRYVTAPPTDPAATIPKFKSGVAVFFLGTIVKYHDLNAYRARIKKNRAQGQSLKSNL